MPQVKQKTSGKKKSFTTPAKEKSKRERAIKKAEEKISLLEEQISEVKTELGLTENLSDYVVLSQLQTKLTELETELDTVLNEWETLCEEDLKNS